MKLTLTAALSLFLSWDPSPNTAAYRVYSGSASHVYTNVISYPAFVAIAPVIVPLPQRSGYFAVSAVGFNGLESVKTEEVYLPPMDYALIVETSDSLNGEWKSVTWLPVTNQQPQQFYRVRLASP